MVGKENTLRGKGEGFGALRHCLLVWFGGVIFLFITFINIRKWEK